MSIVEPVDFRKTAFYKGLNCKYGRIPVKLEIALEFDADIGFAFLGIFVGIDKTHRLKDIGLFLAALAQGQSFVFSKNFIFEPTKMYFEENHAEMIRFLYFLQAKRKAGELNTNEVVLDVFEFEKMLDFLWSEIGKLKFINSGSKICFENDINIGISVDKQAGFALLEVDYREIGDFELIAAAGKYILAKNRSLIIKLPQRKKELLAMLYPHKNQSYVVQIKIINEDIKQFQMDFLEPFQRELSISVGSEFAKELTDSKLLSKVYFDVAAKGIMSKIEYCYGARVINPIDDNGLDKSFREFDSEREVCDELKSFGFKEHGKLFLLEDVEKIMFLLTDKLKKLKELSQVYYSEDFRKLYVKSLNSFGLSLSEDGSVIHMNINLENVSDQELVELLESIKNHKKYYRLRNGSIVNLSNVDSSKLVDLLRSLDLDGQSIKDGAFELPMSKGLFIDSYIKEKNIANVELEPRLANILEQVKNPAQTQLDIAFNGKLRDYQVVGVKWMKNLASLALGGILGDDMGLGKTIQVLAFIASEKERKLPCMVIAPTSMLYNWKLEAEKFVPWLKVLLISGSKSRRALQICNAISYDLVITSFGTLRNDFESYGKLAFSYIFVDEAQNIKNPMTLNANSVKQLKARCCFAITGTPIENRLSELWSIFDFALPGYLFDRNKFVRDFEEPIIKDMNMEKLSELSSMIQPFILRRMKKEVLKELPDKIETCLVSEMTDKQKKLYAAYYKNFKNELTILLQEKGIEQSHMEIFAALTRLRQICVHPGTFLEDYEGGSCKLEAAMDIISEAIAAGHSILLFSQFTRLLKIVRRELVDRGINLYYLDGTMSPEERMMEIDNFNSDVEAVFLISLKSGGTGLNLTKADIVIHFDPWWNPAVEDQASDRAHRIGQKNVVQVYKLLTEGTIEEKILELQQRKRDLIGSVLYPTQSFLNHLNEAEIKGMFGIGD